MAPRRSKKVSKRTPKKRLPSKAALAKLNRLSAGKIKLRKVRKLPERNSLGKFLTKDDADFARKYAPKDDWLPKAERFARTKTTKGKARKSLKKSSIEEFREGPYTKQVFRIRTNRVEAIEQARDWLEKNSRAKSLTWFQLGKTENSNWYGSKPDTLRNTTEKMSSTDAKKYLREERDINADTTVTIEAVILTKNRK